jgi:hypothetical protein
VGPDLSLKLSNLNVLRESGHNHFMETYTRIFLSILLNCKIWNQYVPMKQSFSTQHFFYNTLNSNVFCLYKSKNVAF